MKKFQDLQMQFVRDVSLYSALTAAQSEVEQSRTALHQARDDYAEYIKQLKLHYGMAPVEFEPEWLELERNRHIATGNLSNTQGTKRPREDGLATQTLKIVLSSSFLFTPPRIPLFSVIWIQKTPR